MLDPRFIIAILEHWCQVFIGNQRPLEPIYFFAASENPLSFSDTFLVNSLFYSVFRIFTADEYLAFQGAQFLFLLFGYLTFFYLVRKIFKCSYFASISGSLIFAFSSPMIRQMPAFQNSSTFFLPLLAILFAKFITLATQKDSKQYLYLGFFWILLGAIAFSTFYTLWFLVVYCTFFVPIFLILYRNRLAFLKLMLKPIAFSLLACPVCFAPFLYLYLPMMGAKRNYEEAFGHLFMLADLPNGNTPIWQYLLSISRPTDLNTYPPTIGFLTAILLSFVLYLLLRRKSHFFREWKDSLVLALFFGVFACLAILVKFEAGSLWWFIYNYMPGAMAIRVACRLFFTFSFAASLSLVIVADFLIREKGLKLYRYLLIAFMALAVVDQLGVPVGTISRNEEFSRLGNIQRPPFKTDIFVLADSRVTVAEFDRYHIDAMLLANRFNIPTFFGYSGWLPTKYPVRTLPNLSSEFYETLDVWAKQQNVNGTVAVYNMETSHWEPHKVGN